MTRATLILHSEIEKRKAVHWIKLAPFGTRVEFKRQQRTKDQNRLLWSRLTEISEQLEWHGQRYSPDDWKDYCQHALKKARWMPSEEGGMVPIGIRTSDLTVAEMTELLDLISAFGAQHGVTFADEKEPT